jgi:IclR family acetate operon transcriptional repressor
MSVIPADETRQIVTRLGMPKRARNTITDIEVLMEQLLVIREQGFAVDDEEDADGVVCVAAPAFDTTGKPYATVSITGLKADPLLQDIPLVAASVRRHADALTALVRIHD